MAVDQQSLLPYHLSIMYMKKQNWVLLAIGLATVACGRLGKKEQGNADGQRIVSVSKHITEMLFALGEGKNIVGCDLSSTYPDSAKLITAVGYHRALNPEGIISLRPDVVMHSNDIGPETVVPQLEKAGLNVKVFGGANTPDSAMQLLKELGSYFKKETVADSLVTAMQTSLKAAADSLTSLHANDTPSVMIIHFGRANNIYFVMSGRKGPGDKMIELAGGKTAAYDGKGARQLSAEAVALANPDVIIATDFGFDQMGSVEKFKELPGVSLTNAAKNNRIYRFEEHDLLYFGPRSGKNILALMHLLHPAVK